MISRLEVECASPAFTTAIVWGKSVLLWHNHPESSLWDCFYVGHASRFDPTRHWTQCAKLLTKNSNRRTRRCSSWGDDSSSQSSLKGLFGQHVTQVRALQLACSRKAYVLASLNSLPSTHSCICTFTRCLWMTTSDVFQWYGLSTVMHVIYSMISRCVGATNKRKMILRKCGLTKRAPDVWESARFTSIFLASSFFCSQAESTPAHTQVTQTVGPLIFQMAYPND